MCAIWFCSWRDASNCLVVCFSLCRFASSLVVAMATTSLSVKQCLPKKCSLKFPTNSCRSWRKIVSSPSHRVTKTSAPLLVDSWSLVDDFIWNLYSVTMWRFASFCWIAHNSVHHRFSRCCLLLRDLILLNYCLLFNLTALCFRWQPFIGHREAVCTPLSLTYCVEFWVMYRSYDWNNYYKIAYLMIEMSS